FDRGERLAELGAHSGRGGRHGFEHMLLIRGLALRTSERGSILAIDRLNGERIRLSQAHDTAFDGGGSRVTHTDVMGEGAGDYLCGRAAHQPKVLPHL